MISIENIYPNPSIGKSILRLFINSNENISFENTRLTIFNILGEKVYEVINHPFNNGQNELEIPTMTFINGVYFGSIKTKNSVHSFKLVVQQ
jgi:hypothetical protein